MRKKLILGMAVGVMTAMSLTACANKTTAEPATSAPVETTTEVAVQPTTEDFEEDKILVEGMETVPSDETEEAVEAPEEFNQTMVDVAEVLSIEDGQIAIMTEKHGEVHANISEDTIVSEGIKVGDMVGISHSNVMTMSLPGIWPQVYSVSSIVENGEQLTCDVYVPSTELTNENDTPYILTVPEKVEGMDRVMFNVVPMEREVVEAETIVDEAVSVEKTSEEVVEAETLVDAEAIEFTSTVATVKEIMDEAILVSFDGTEAIASITEDTKVAEGIEVGMDVTVVHTDIMTRSLPGIWPQVSEINIVE